MNIYDIYPELKDHEGFFCETCNSSGGLHIAGVTYLDVDCPTCHGLSRGMSADEYFKQLQADAEWEERNL